MRIAPTTILVVSFLGGALAAVACGGSQPPAETAPPPPSSEPAPSAPPSASAEAEAPSPSAEPAASASAAPAQPSWEEMTKDQRKELMKTVVLPQMKGVFQELDAKDFASMSCTTCHGDGAKQGKFDMPNPKLPKLDPANGFEKHAKKSPKATKLMMERVAPGMAKILGLPPYDPKTNKGFGCFNCHTMAGK